MRNRMLLILLIAALSATVVLQNTGTVAFSFLWANVTLAKSTMILAALAIGFIAGISVRSFNTTNNDARNKNKDDEDYLS